MIVHLNRWNKRLLGTIVLCMAVVVAAAGYPASYAKALAGEEKGALYTIITDYIDRYGIHTGSDIYGTGLVYASLADFDRDGVSELQVIYLDWFSDQYTHEIWQYRNGQAALVMSEQDGQEGLIGDRAVSRSSTQSGDYVFYTSSYSRGDSYRGNSPYDMFSSTTYQIYTIRSGSWVKLLTLDQVWEDTVDGRLPERTTYYVTKGEAEEKVSEAGFKRMLADYGYGQRQQLVLSSAGSKEFAPELAQPKQAIELLLQQMRAALYPQDMPANEYNRLSQDEQHKLIAFLSNFGDAGTVDMARYDDATIMQKLKNMNFHGSLEDNNARKLRAAEGESVYLMRITDDEGSYEWPFTAYRADVINEVLLELFGVEAALQDNGYALYKNGYFYIPDIETGSGLGADSHQVRGYYPIGDGLYYVEFDTYFLEVESVRGTNGWEWVYPYGLDPRKAWSKDSLPDEYYSGQGYAVVEAIGHAKWRVVEFSKQDFISRERWAEYKRGLAARKTPSDWATGEVELAVGLQLVPMNMQGWYGNDITRAEFSKLAVNLLSVRSGRSIDQLLAVNGTSIRPGAFNDTSDREVLAANALGIVTGKGNGVFDPHGKITRQEAAVMLARTAKLLGVAERSGQTGYADQHEIADWARSSVAHVAAIKDSQTQNAVMGSTGKDRFDPRGSFTRQQAYMTMLRLYNGL